MPLASRMRETVPDALQPWYCDNEGLAGTALPNAHFLYFLVKFGPQYGYFPALGHLPSLLPSQRHVVGAAKRGSRQQHAGATHQLLVGSSVFL